MDTNSTSSSSPVSCELICSTSSASPVSCELISALAPLVHSHTLARAVSLSVQSTIKRVGECISTSSKLRANRVPVVCVWREWSKLGACMDVWMWRDTVA